MFRRSVSRAHEISAGGNLFLQGLLCVPNGWLLRSEQSDGKDYHLDYSCESIEQGNPSGNQIRIQLKTAAKAAFRNGHVSHSFDVHHLRYYAERCRVPVFLVLVCMFRRKAYWVFAQQYLREKMSRGWQERVTARIQFSDASSLDVDETFRTAVANSFGFMDDIHPGSLKASAARRVAELQAKYPEASFKVALREDGVEHVTINPHTTISGEISFQFPTADEDAKRRLRAFLTGQQATFKKGELSVSGILPFAEERKKASEIGIRAGGILPSLVSVRRSSKQPSVSQTVMTIPAETTVNIGGYSLRTTDEQCPVIIEMSKLMDPQYQERLGKDPSRVTYDLRRWIGERVAALPYFREMVSLAEGVREGVIHEIVAQAKGHSAQIGIIRGTGMSDLAALVEAIQRMVEADRAFELGLVFPDFDTVRESDERILSSLWSAYRHKRALVPWSLSGVLEVTEDVAPGKRTIVIEPCPEIPLLGVNRVLKNAALELENCVIERVETGEYHFRGEGPTYLQYRNPSEAWGKILSSP